MLIIQGRLSSIKMNAKAVAWSGIPLSGPPVKLACCFEMILKGLYGIESMSCDILVLAHSHAIEQFHPKGSVYRRYSSPTERIWSFGSCDSEVLR